MATVPHPVGGDAPRYTLRQLAYFVTAAELGTTGAAAEAHVMSQSAISSALTDLERALGVQLLIRRKAKGVSLTQAGRELLPRARALLGAADELQAEAGDVGETPSGRLVIGCHLTIAPYVLPRLLQGFEERHPSIQVDFVEGTLPELQALLLDGSCELAVMYDLDIDPRIDRSLLYAPAPHVLLPVGHRLADRPVVSLRELADEPLVMLDVAPSAHFFASAFAVAGVAPRIRHRTVSFEHARMLVARGLGWTLLTQRNRATLGHWGDDVVSRPIAEEVPPQPIVLAQPAGVRRTRRAQVFAAYCREAFTEIARPAGTAGAGAAGPG